MPLLFTTFVHYKKSKKGKVDNLYRDSKRSNRCRTATTILPLFIGPMPLAATYRSIDMKALARYQFILLGEQRHIGVNNLPKVVARQCSGQESNPRPLDHKSDMLTTTAPSHYTSCYATNSIIRQKVVNNIIIQNEYFIFK